MADSSVQQSGGDFTTLASALADAGTGDGDTITISGTWSVLDTDTCVVADDNITIIATGDSRVTTADHVAGSPNHYRLHTGTGNTAHVFTVNNTGCIIDGLDIWLRSSGSSDECVRMAADGGTLTVKNSILRSDHDVVSQDGIYTGSIDCTVNVENCIIYNFDRAGLHSQITGGTHTQTWNINSCTIWQCGETGETDGGGIAIYRGISSATQVINVHNTMVLDCSIGGDDYDEFGANSTTTWNISYSIDSDNSIVGRDGGGVGNLASRTIRDSTAGGDEVLVNDITGAAPFDLSLIDDGTNNDAQDAHTTDTAEGLTITATDIDGTSRPQNTNHDIGAFEIVAAVGGRIMSSLAYRGGLAGGGGIAGRGGGLAD